MSWEERKTIKLEGAELTKEEIIRYLREVFNRHDCRKNKTIKWRKDGVQVSNRERTRRQSRQED
jgi:hypothetical protein